MTSALVALILAYNGLASFPMPDHCVPTYCEDYVVHDDGSLLCADTDELYPAGHWAYDTDPDYGDLQVTVEY